MKFIDLTWDGTDRMRSRFERLGGGDWKSTFLFTWNRRLFLLLDGSFWGKRTIVEGKLVIWINIFKKMVKFCIFTKEFEMENFMKNCEVVCYLY